MKVYNIFTQNTEVWISPNVAPDGVIPLDPRMVYTDLETAQAIADRLNHELLERIQRGNDMWNQRRREGEPLREFRPEQLIHEPGYCWVEELKTYP